MIRRAWRALRPLLVLAALAVLLDSLALAGPPWLFLPLLPTGVLFAAAFARLTGGH